MTRDAAVVVQTKPKEKKKKNNANRVNFWAVECKYSVILDVVTSLGWRLIDDERFESKVNLYWIDVAAIHERFRTIQPWQMINHFPGMPNIARKNRMGQNLNRMQRMFPKEYAFYPRTWILPTELNDFRTQFDGSGVSLNNKIFIIKPDAGCQGRGIFLTRTLDNVPLTENVVAQVYIKKPMLLDNYKFDLRIYVYVAGVKPLRLYLFHDGLVRMCTEEYVKPTKHNLNQMCMHLTNYAVNKHNNNFAQPNSIEDQDHSSKRSLLWFMQYVGTNFGDDKANWLWRRIGVLCTRTILSILPTLSREYDAHFKSFSNIPVDASQIPSTATAVGGGSGGGGGLTGRLPVAPGLNKNLAGSTVYSNRKNSSNKESGSEEDEEEEKEDENIGDSNSNNNNNNTADDKSASQDPLKPKIRGSRCFEILGFDIMIDSNLNPTLIEVNHLPSFGTDSALDLDIKDRLMQQVFSVLPTLPDDYTAYAAHMKAEAERRQVEKLQQQQAAANQAKILRSNPPPRRRENSVERRQSTASTQSAPPLTSEPTPQEVSVKVTADEKTATEMPQEQNIEVVEEECTTERIVEIKRILKEVYAIHSPEKISKIDRLLHKYIGHEEEFLRFVYAKYNVSPSVYEKPRPSPVSQVANFGTQDESKGVVQQQNGEENEEEEENEENDEQGENDDQEDTQSVQESKSVHQGRNTEISNKRYSRSLSPRRNKKTIPLGNNANQPNSRLNAAWKSQPDEEAQFKSDVFKEHIPTEEEEWMKFEMSKLSQFTRIFPPVPKSRCNYMEAIKGHVAIHSMPFKSNVEEMSANNGDNNDNEDEEENKEEEEEDENSNNNTGTNGNNNAISNNNGTEGSKKKSASYEEIIYQVFLQDRRQTMRLRCPLPNRAKADDNSSSFLPPLDAPTSSRSSLSTMGTGKGVVGWKAPPKPQNKETPRQPTISQLESAKRLSQGLSTAANIAKARQASASASVETYSVVLDNTDYSINSQGVYGDAAWASTKANRLYEESRRNRMRVEAQRSQNASVLRQQIFFFDPNYENIAAPPAALGSEASLSGLGNAGGGMNESLYATTTAGNTKVRIPSQPPLPNGVNSKTPTYWQGSSNAPNASNVVVNGGGGPRQEELLKQLFPSWF